MTETPRRYAKSDGLSLCLCGCNQRVKSPRSMYASRTCAVRRPASGARPITLHTPKVVATPTKANGESWWIHLDRAELNAQAAVRFATSAPTGLVCQHQGFDAA